MTLVAEDLAPVRDPLATWLRPGAQAPAREVAARLAAAFLPSEADDPPPAWLRADQRLSYRRGLAVVRKHGGTLVADAVGTGKTYIALAIAAALEPGRPVHVLVPATLREQWLRAAAATGRTVRLHSHETLSRGRVPDRSRGPVIIDESHRFRTPATRRYRTLAPWCLGRRGILLSATPVVNRIEDLRHQLELFVPANAPLADLVVTGADRAGCLPRRREQTITVHQAPGLAATTGRLGRLALSRDRPIAELIRVSLFRAAASSPAALGEALSRYHSLLLHAADAAAAGRHLTRDAIRRFVGADDQQLVLWPLVAEASAAVELAPGDVEHLPGLLAAAARAARSGDPKAEALVRLLSDRRPTMVFSGSIATLRYLRERIPGHGIAWLSGQGAGIDAMPADREVVLDWFRRPPPDDGRMPRPSVLLATDVAAEGLDLPLIERIVHYDLPWTAVRLEQRAGRAIRLGSRHEAVEIVRCLPPPALERALRQQRILGDKAGLPALIGLDAGEESPWRIRARLAAEWEGCPQAEGVAAARGRGTGVVAGVRIELSNGTARELVLARVGTSWRDEPDEIARLLDSAGPASRLVTRPAAHAALRGLSLRVAALLRQIHGQAIGPDRQQGSVRSVLRRLRELSARFARSRDAARLAVVANALKHLRRGHTAGEAARIAQWARLPDAALLASLTRLAAEPAVPVPVSVKLIGLLLVEA